MSCFMGYNPLVAKEVKITTWIKEFDGDSPVYPSFPNDGDCFVVFATDEDALTHNALSKKTYTNGDWADAEGGGGGDFSIAEVTFVDCNTDSSSYKVVCPVVEVETDTIMCTGFSVKNTDATKVSVPLYKNSFYLSVNNFYDYDSSVIPTTEGDIELDIQMMAFHIYGNGTITIKGNSEA